MWWAGTWNSRDSALSRLLLARGPDGEVAIGGARPPSDDEAQERFRALASAAPGCVSVERAGLSGLPVAWSGPDEEPPRLAAATFDRELDRLWRRTSYSDITAGAHEARVASEPEEAVLDDEPAEGSDEEIVADPALPLADIPGGVRFGTFVHSVFEVLDFAATDEEIADVVREVAAAAARGDRVGGGGRRRAAAGARDAARAARRPAVRRARAPTGWTSSASSCRWPAATRPWARSRRARSRRCCARISPADDPMAAYATRLSDPDLRASVRGYLTGSIDLVFRVGEAFAVVDYKTNVLAVPGETLTPAHYRPAALAAEMMSAHYGLQALLYTAALHRYLRWRLARL